MKGKFSLIWRVAVALVLVLSFSLVAAVPAAASPASIDAVLVQKGNATAEWSTEKAHTGTYSAKLTIPIGATWADGARVKVLYGELFSTISNATIKYWYSYDGTPHNSFIRLDMDENGNGIRDHCLISRKQASTVYDGTWTETLQEDLWEDYTIVEATQAGTATGTWKTLAAWKADVGTFPVATAKVMYLLVMMGPTTVPQIATESMYIDDITIDGVTYDLGAASFVNASDVEIQTVPSDGTFYLYVESDAWNISEFVEDTGQVTLQVYSVYTAPDVLVSTTVYTATESGNNTGHFRTPAISGADLGLKPGYKLVASCPAGATDNSVDYAQAKVSFDKAIYSIDEEMVLTVEDDSLNLVATTPNTITLNTPATVTKLDINKKGGATTGNLTLTETGINTGIFQVKVTPRNADGTNIWCNDAMDFAYTNTNTTTGAGTGGSNIITKTAYVSPTSPSSVAFAPSTIAVTATSVDVVVIDRDESADGATATDDHIYNAVVVKSLAADDSVIDSLTVATLNEFSQAGKFHQTVTFGSAATQLDVTGAAKLQATYTDPNDSADVSTGTAVIGTTVDLLDATGTVKKSYTSITGALTGGLIDDNYTILVKSGYASGDETWPIDISTGKAGLTIKADTPGIILDPWAAAQNEDAIDVSDTTLTIDGFTIRNSDPTTGHATNLIHIDGAATNLTIKNCTFDLTAGAANDEGIYLTVGQPATPITISGCTFDVGALATGIDTSANNETIVYTVKDCTFTGSGGTGLNIDTAVNATTATVKSNTFDGLKNALVIAEASGTTTVELKWNTIKNCTWVTPGTGAIEISNAPAVSIVGNDIKDNAGYSVWVKTGASDDDVDVVFNNITGNTKVLKTEDTAGVKLNAKHNWWGHTTAPTTSDVSSLTYVDTTYYLTAAAKLTAEYTEAADGLFDKHLTTGVKVSAAGTGATDADVIGVAEYAESPKAELSGASFYDVFVATYGTDGTSNVTIQFYTPGISADSVVYFWNSLAGEWQACSNRGYNSYDEYIWVLARDQTVTVPTYPTIQELVGGMFAISVEEVRTLQSIAVTPATTSIGVGGTKQFTATGTYNLEPLTEDITAEVTWASSDVSVATIDATGLATGVAEGITNITATLGTIVSAPAVLTVSVFDPMIYDADEDGVISKTEAITAVVDYFDGEITKENALAVIVEYMG